MAAPFGDYWRFVRKLTVTQLLGPQQLERSRGVRGEELERFYVKLLEKARRGEVVDVPAEIAKLMNRAIHRIVMGRMRSEDNGEAEMIKDFIKKKLGAAVIKLIIRNMFRPLKRFWISLFEKDTKDHSHRFDLLLEKILKEHEEHPTKENKDMMDLLLEAYHDEKAQYNITRNQIKSFIVDILHAGTNSTMTAKQWIMAELINNPKILEKLREEIESVVGKERMLGEHDLPNLPYLLAVVKEGLRLHPPAAISIRKCRKSCKVGGFDIPEGALLVMNHYAVMRSPESWEDPYEFRPERFLVVSSKSGQKHHNHEDKMEQVMKYIPFGGGRRRCPAENLSYITIRMTIGTMFQYFDWKIEGDEASMEEKGGFALTMAHPLKCTPVLRFNPLAYL